MTKTADLATLSDSEAFRILAESPISMVLTDPALPDNPIVYVNAAFERVTGYGPDAAIGRNCRFLQGEATDPEDTRRIRKAIADQTETTVDIVNYTAGGEKFLNRLLLTPVYDRSGALKHFLGIQKRLTPDEAMHSANVTTHTIRELKHRVKNHLAMIVGMIRLEGRGAGASAAVASLARRVESLQVLYEELSEPTAERRAGNVALDAYVARLVNTTRQLDTRSGITVETDLADATCSSQTAGKAGLVVSEVLTNAFQHAFEGRDTGRLSVRLHQDGNGWVTITVSDDGVGIPDGTDWPDMSSVGGRVVSGLLADLEAELDVTTGTNGTIITLKFPVDDHDR